MENLFIIASRKKLRVSSTKGMLSVEDLWDLSSRHLNEIYKSVMKEIKSQEAEEFSLTETSQVDENLLMISQIVEYVYKTLRAERESAKNALERKEKKQRIAELISKKKEAALAEMEIEDLEKMLQEV